MADGRWIFVIEVSQLRLFGEQLHTHTYSILFFYALNGQINEQQK